MSGPGGVGERRVNAVRRDDDGRPSLRRPSHEPGVPGPLRGGRAPRWRRPGPLRWWTTSRAAGSSFSSSTPSASNTCGSTGRWVHTTAQLRESSSRSSTALRTDLRLASSSLRPRRAPRAPSRCCRRTAGGCPRSARSRSWRAASRRTPRAGRPAAAPGGARARPAAARGPASPLQPLRDRALAWRSIDTAPGSSCARGVGLGERRPVPLVGQPLLGLVGRHPHDLVDLVVDEVARHVVVAHRPADPVVDGLRARPADRVALRRERRGPAGRAARSPRRPRAPRRPPACSPGSSLPLGNDQSSYAGRCTSSTSSARAEDDGAGGDDVTCAAAWPLVSHHPDRDQEARVRKWTAAGVAVLPSLAAVVVGLRWWQSSQSTDFERAVALAPADAQRLTYTDWAGVRRELGVDLDADSSADEVDQTSSPTRSTPTCRRCRRCWSRRRDAARASSASPPRPSTGSC